jgi:hypothetical protein
VASGACAPVVFIKEGVVSMNKETQRFEIQWQGFVIEVRYCPDRFDSYREIYGYALAHLEVESIHPVKAPLSMTETGYRSHLDSADNINDAGGPVAFVQAWIDHEAQSPAWKAQQAQSRQGLLF